MKKKIVVFSGAGLDAESNIPTFRDSSDGMYLDKKVEDAFSVQGWKKNKGFVLDLHNELRNKISTCEPNEAHKLISGLEEKYEVVNVTQNITPLLEQVFCQTVYHLHGEINKVRSSLDGTIFEAYGDTKLGDKCSKGSQIRPHTVFFGEQPYNVQEAYDALSEADILIVIGTSLSISYTIPLLGATSAKEIYYIDPEPSKDLEYQLTKFNKPLPIYIKKKAVEGMKKLYKKLMK